MAKNNQCESPKMVKFYPFEEYSEKFKDIFLLEKSERGVITAKWHCDGDSAFWDYPLHRGIGQLCWHVGQDADATVLIIGGAGDQFLRLGPTSLPEDVQTQTWSLYEHSYYDGTNMIEGLINDVEVPTIGIINGGLAVHSEIALLCDITLMAEDAVIFDPHYSVAGSIPGDGIQIAFRAALGYKRANYAMLMGEKITAQKALEYGMVNEVLPREKIYERAQEIAEKFAAFPRYNTRMLSQVLRAPIKEQIASELRPVFGCEMWGNLTSSVGNIGDAKTHDEAFAKMNRQFEDEK